MSILLPISAPDLRSSQCQSDLPQADGGSVRGHTTVHLLMAVLLLVSLASVSGCDSGRGHAGRSADQEGPYGHLCAEEVDMNFQGEPVDLGFMGGPRPDHSIISFSPERAPQYAALPEMRLHAGEPEPFLADALKRPGSSDIQAPDDSDYTLLWPLANITINSPFGWRYHPILRRRIFHRGTDFGGSRGDPIVSIGPGRVTFAGWSDPGSGIKVVVEHPGSYTSVYCHLSAVTVEPGMEISKGTIIGLMGMTGRTTGNHLHLEIYRNGRALNPMRVLGKDLRVTVER